MLTGSVDGGDHADKIARVLKDAGDDELERAVERQVDQATRRMAADAKAAAKKLPGGLAKRVAGSKIVAHRRGDRVTITATGMHQLGLIDTGKVMHPVFGNGDVWATQSITAGWFSDPMDDGRDNVKRAVDDGLDDAAHTLARKLDQR